jgi:diacylglycerol kinase (ATP)
MKHIFVVNPAAGDGSAPAYVREKLGGKKGIEIYETGVPGDATDFVRRRSAASGEALCFVACGGDGTVNEVASALALNPRDSMSILPLGSGNDFVKAFGGAERFMDVEALLNAVPRPIDILKVGERWAVNAFHFGLDAAVAKTMADVKPKPIIGGRNAYPTGVVKAILCDMRTYCRMEVDGELLHDGDILLCTVANGEYVGGSYRCAPRSLQDDGLAEICLVTPVSRLRFLRLMNAYKEGTHLDDPRFDPMVHYRRGRVIEVGGRPGFMVSLDGEIVEGTAFRVEVIRGGLLFAPPGTGKTS